MSVTAKVYCNSKTLGASMGATAPSGAQVTFTCDYSDGRNKEWAQATPWLDLKMSVKDADLFELGKSYTLTFDEDVPAPAVVAAPTAEAAAAPTAAPTA